MIKCLHPIRIKSRHPLTNELHEIYVPCGRCVHCINRRVNDWIFRLKCELDSCINCCFATLTVDNDHIDDVHKDPKGVFQKFIKRLRKNCPYSLHDCRFKYFCVSELGHEKGRIHYHVLFYNYLHDFWSFQKFLTQTWKQGMVYIEPVSLKRIRYCAKYMLNSLFNTRGYHYFETVKKYNKRFNCFSDFKVRKYHKPFSWYFSLKSQGFGYCYLTKDRIFYLLRNDFQIPYSTKSGENRKFSLPRQLYNKLCSTMPSLKLPQLKALRYEKVIESSAAYRGYYYANSKLLRERETGEEANLGPLARRCYKEYRQVIVSADSLYKSIFSKMNFKVPPLSPFEVPPKYQKLSSL